MRSKETLKLYIYIYRKTVHYEAERIALGEECDFHFVADVLEAGIDQWNSAVQRLKTRLSKPETLCQELQKQLVEMEGTGSTEPISQEGLNTMVEDLSTSLAPKLRTISTKRTTSNFTPLGRLNFRCTRPFSHPHLSGETRKVETGPGAAKNVLRRSCRTRHP